ncbi:MAG: Na/Pi cotransporter family protein, partial [Anaerolineales bacterium]
ANIGTCATGLIASAGLSRAARQASIAQILINVAGVLIFLPFLSPFIHLVSRTSPSLPRQIANAHTLFNVIVSLMLFPFVRYIAKIAKWMAPELADNTTKVTAYIDYMQYKMPSVAITEANRELLRMGEMTTQMIECSRKALINNDMAAAMWVIEKEEAFVDPVTDALETFVNGLIRENLNAKQHKHCFQIKNLITDVERIGDLSENLAEVAQKKVENKTEFSPVAILELDRLFQHMINTYALALQAVQTTDLALAQRVGQMEDEFDRLYIESRQAHVQRIEANVCHPEADLVFIESIRNLERISDHADNIGISTLTS